MIATGEERAAGNEDKGSRRRPAGSEVHLRYHLPVFSPRYAYARAYVRASRVVTAFYPRVWRANCASRRSLYDLPSQKLQRGAATIHLLATALIFCRCHCCHIRVHAKSNGRANVLKLEIRTGALFLKSIIYEKLEKYYSCVTYTIAFP